VIAPTPRHVLHLVTALGVGGTELQLVELLRLLRGTRWRSRLASLRPPEGLLAEVRALGIAPEIVPLPGSLWSPAAPLAIARLAWRLRRERVALLHCHDLYAILVGLPAARLAGTPVIAARRDLGHHLGRVHRLALARALGLATAVLTNSEAVATSIVASEVVSRARIAVVPNCIDLDRFDARAREAAAPLPEEAARARVVLTVANLSYAAKGHDDLLEAAALARAAVPDLRFLVAGDGPREGELRRRARDLGLEGVVLFLGRRGDVPALLARADVVCHPARSEGMPNAVIEAMAAARPIVATTAGGTPELIRDGVHGLLVPPSSPRALAAALRVALSEPARMRRLGEAARRRVARELSPARLGERIDALYGAVAEGYYLS
jgi:glycosyltransferase involved in cell wall biosynthesis